MDDHPNYLPYHSVSNPRRTANPKLIDVDVVFPHLGPNPVPYTAAEVDPGWPHSDEIYARVVNGEFGPIADYVPPEE